MSVLDKIFSNRKRVRDSMRDRKQKDIIRDIDLAYEKIFSVPESDLFFYDLGNFCGVLDTSFRKDNSHADMAFKEGARAVFLYIQDRVEKAKEDRS